MSSEITNPGERKLVVVSGRAHPKLAEEIAQALDHDLLPTSAYTFANGETYVRFEESVRGADAFVIQSHPAPINEWLMEQLIMIDALKRASARSITVVSPFYPSARQDKKHKGREPISARLISDLYKTAWFGTLMSRVLCTKARGAPSSRVAQCSATRTRPVSGDTTVTFDRSSTRSRMCLASTGIAKRWSSGPSKKP